MSDADVTKVDHNAKIDAPDPSEASNTSNIDTPLEAVSIEGVHDCPQSIRIDTFLSLYF